MSKIKNLFETINQKALNLISPKEIYSYLLKNEEKNNFDLDYISGFQILDDKIRITILEGIKGKGMKQIKDCLEKKDINNNDYKIYSDERILFSERIYSEFNLCLKYIKLRSPLRTILTTYDIYSKSKKYPEIYETFMGLASILRGDTLEIISNCDLIPNSTELLLLERKYADILVEEDMTGIKSTKKRKKRKRILDTNTNNTITNSNTDTNRNPTNNNLKNNKSHVKFDLSKTKKKSNENSLKNSKEIEKNNLNNSNNTMNNVSETESNLKQNKEENKIQESDFAKSMKNVLLEKKIIVEKVEKKKSKSKLDSRNVHFDSIKQNYIPRKDHHKDNLARIEHLNELNKKNNKYKLFCTREVNNDFKGEVHPYSSSRLNYWVLYMEQQRQKYENDKNAFYSYSKDFLQLKLPQGKHYDNYEYYLSQENKKVRFRLIRNGLILKVLIDIRMNTLKKKFIFQE